MNKLLTLCIVQKDEQVLLGFKKIGFGAGRWNGFGGKVEEGETIEAAAIRETKEEAGIDVEDMEEVAVIEFEFTGNPVPHEVHAFFAGSFKGEPSESDEMRPEWFAIEDIPYHLMWPDDKYWLPLLLAGKKLKGKFVLGKEDVILTQELTEVESL